MAAALKLIPIQIGKLEIEHCLNLEENRNETQTYILPFHFNNVTCKPDPDNVDQEQYYLRLFQFLIPPTDIFGTSNYISHNGDKESYTLYPILCQTQYKEDFVYIKNIEFTSLGNDPDLGINISLTTSKQEIMVKNGEINEDLKKYGLYIEKERSDIDFCWCIYYKIDFNDNNFNKKIKVSFSFGGKTQALILCICHNSYISDVVLDCGAESTQYLRYDRATEDEQKIGEDNIGNIYEKMVNYYRVNDFQGRLEQKNKETDKLFQSIYFYNPTPRPNLEPCVKLQNPVENEQQILYVQTTTDEAWTKLCHDKQFKVLPQIKTNKDIREHNDYYFLRTVICQYARAIFNTIQQDFENTKSVRFVVLNILIPYMFNSHNTQKLHTELTKDIETVIKDFEKIRAVELHFIYESDAPAMGAIKLMEQDERSHAFEGNYLLLDAGKSTLDFSIIQYHNNNFICKYRSGIPGAGNALTYAYMCSLIKSYIKDKTTDSDIQNYIYNNILKEADKKDIYDLYQAVEEFKRRPNGQNGQQCQQAQPGDKEIIKLTKHIKSINEIKGDDKAYIYIDRYIKYISHKVAEEVKTRIGSDGCKIDKVIFAGRAFKCKAFEEGMGKCLKQHKLLSNNEDYTFKYLNGINEKQIALLVCFQTNNGQYYKLPSLPMIQRERCNNIDGIIDTLFNFFKKISQYHEQEWISLYDNMRRNPLITSRPSIKRKTDEKNLCKYGLHHGFDINYAKTDKLFYNGHYFNIAENTQDQENLGSGKMKLFIANGSIYIRKQKSKGNSRCYKFTPTEYNFGEESLLMLSTNFPDITATRMEDIPIITQQILDDELNEQEMKRTSSGGENAKPVTNEGETKDVNELIDDLINGNHN